MAGDGNGLSVNVVNREGQLFIELSCNANASELQSQIIREIAVIFDVAKVANQGVDAALSADSIELSPQCTSANLEKAKATRDF